MSQRSIKDYLTSPSNMLKDYKIRTTEWLGKSINITPKPEKKGSRKARSQKACKSSVTSAAGPLHIWTQKKENCSKELPKKLSNNNEAEVKENSEYDSISEDLKELAREGRIRKDYIILDSDDSRENIPAKRNNTFTPKGRGSKKSNGKSPLDIWLQRKSKTPSEQTKDDMKLKRKLLRKTDSFEKYGTSLPTVDDILKNIDSLNRETELLDNFDSIDCDFSTPWSLNRTEETPDVTWLNCHHLSESDLESYFLKFSDSMKNISNGTEFSQRHQTYKDCYSRSRLTYNFSTSVFNKNQLEYLMEKTEKEFDPDDERTDYLFMVLLPELCFKIFMDHFEMTKEEAVDYLRKRPFD